AMLDRECAQALPLTGEKKKESAMIDVEARLLAMQRLSVDDQRARRSEVIELFDALWMTEPDRETFASLTQNLVLFPEMLYTMATDRRPHA
ncbi:MAG: hypothetical protein Q8S13_11420, partial [Dehalococcoidia bacterium]|nr:hypothetical protein [Dehalococcoidia bacterium]